MKTNKNAALLLLILSALMFFGIFQAAYADDITEPPSVVEPAPDPTPTADPGEPTPEPTGEPENPGEPTPDPIPDSTPEPVEPTPEPEVSELVIKTTSLLGAQVNKYYERKLVIEGGTAPYNVTVAADSKNQLPDGLAYDSDTGNVCGTPSQSGTYWVTFVVTDSSATAQTVQKEIRISVSKQRVDFTAAGASYIYDGNPHSPTSVRPSGENAPELTEGVDYVVSYGSGEQEYTNAGSYRINVTMLNDQYRLGSVSPSMLIIYQAPGAEITASSVTSRYDGLPHPINYTVTSDNPESAEHTVIYTGIYDTVYGPTSEPPSDPGVYEAVVRTTNTNYRTDSKTAYVNILTYMVDFNISGNVYTYDGDFHTVNSISIVNPIEEFTEDDYTVTYTNTSADYPEETNLVSVKDAGSYRIDIKFKDRPDNPDKPFSKMYSARLNTSIMIINKQTVPFKAENTVAYYDGNVKKASVTPQNPDFGFEEETDYTVVYTRDGEITAEPKEAGTYNISVSLTDVRRRNYNAGTVAPSVFRILSKEGVAFNISNTEYVYDAVPKQADVNPIDYTGGFTVTYDDSSTEDTVEEYTSVTDAGIYNIIITLDDESYQVGEIIGSDKLVIAPAAVKVTLSDLEQEYDGHPKYASYSSDNDNENLQYTIIYTKEEQAIAEPTEIGAYSIDVTLSDERNYALQITPENPVLNIIQPRTAVDFTVSNHPSVYTGSYQEADITPVPADFTDYAVTYRKAAAGEPEQGSGMEGVSESGGENEGETEDGNESEPGGEEPPAPPAGVLDAGTYEIVITITNSDYKLGTITGDTIFTVSPKPVNFTVSEYTHQYDGSDETKKYKANVQPDITDFTDYTVTYDNDATPEQEEYTEVSEAGAYSISIKLTAGDNYTLGTVSPENVKLQILLPVDFTISNHPSVYTGEYQEATITPNPESFADYTVTYKKITENNLSSDEETDEEAGGEEPPAVPAGVLNAGTYEIVITITNSDYKLGTITGDTIFTVSPKPVNFTVSEYTHQYDGSDETKKYKANVQPDITDFTDYTVTYDNDATPEQEEYTEVSEAGAYSISIKLTAGDNYTLGTVSPENVKLQILLPVDFTISNHPSVYTGEYQEATITPNPESFADYTVTYKKITENNLSYGEETDEGAGGEEPPAVPAGVLNAGDYEIVITITDSAYGIGTITGDTAFTVAPKSVNFTVTDYRQKYDASDSSKKYKATVEPDIPGFTAYTVTYDDEATPDIAEEYADVSAKGIYNISIKLTAGDNYALGAISPENVKLDIYSGINFTVSEHPSVYTGEPQQAKVTPDSDLEGLTYTVAYLNAEDETSEPLQAVTDAGTYTTVISITDGIHELGSVTDAQFTVSPKTISFTAENTRYLYSGEQRTALVTPPENFEELFTVSYGADNAESVSEIGVYSININIQNKNYSASVTPPNLEILARSSLAFGNSPYGKIAADQSLTPEQKQEMREAFDETRIFDDKIYTEQAWTGTSDMDRDEHAIFVEDLFDVGTDGINAYYSDLSEVPSDQITVTVKNVLAMTSGTDGLANAQNVGDITIGEDALGIHAVPGIYTVEYSYNDGDETLSETGTVVITGRIGDANLDGDINRADIRMYSYPDRITETGNKIYIYRICDVNGDGEINEADAQAVSERADMPLPIWY